MHFVDEPDVDNPFERAKVPDLKKQLITSKSSVGIFNWSMFGLMRLLAQGKFTETAEQVELKGAFKTDTDSVDSFVAECNSDWQRDKIYTRKEIYDLYVDYCINASKNIVPNQSFHDVFRKAFASNQIKTYESRIYGGDRYYKFLYHLVILKLVRAIT